VPFGGGRHIRALAATRQHLMGRTVGGDSALRAELGASAIRCGFGRDHDRCATVLIGSDGDVLAVNGRWRWLPTARKEYEEAVVRWRAALSNLVAPELPL
jgi:hypothetical protein